MKPGRNDPCSCGSGRKYKKCCASGKALVPSPNSRPLARETALTGCGPPLSAFTPALALFKGGKLAESEACVRELLTRFPQSVDAWLVFGQTLRAQGKPALEAYRNAARFGPNDADAHFRYGEALAQFGKSVEAMASYRTAVTIDAQLVSAQLGICTQYIVNGKIERAREQADLLEKFHPLSAESYVALGRVSMAIGHCDEALDHFKRALTICPDWQKALPIATLEHLNRDGRSIKEKLFYAGMTEKAEARAREDFENDPSVENHNFLLMCMHANPERSAQDYFEEARKWASLHGKEDLLLKQPAFRNDQEPNRRLKVGILGDYFTNKICLNTLIPFFKRYDRGQLEVYCYNYGDSMEGLAGLVDRWQNIHQHSGTQFFDLVQSDRIDIMLDINGRLKNPLFFQTMLRQPAPIQVNWYNLTATVGHRAYNYLIADEYSILPGEEGLYVEKIFKMPTGTITSCDMHEAPPEPSPLPCEERGFVTFGSFGDFFKVNERVLETWGKLLNRVPNSRLYLKGNYLQFAENRKRITDFYQTLGVTSDRVLLEGTSDYELMKKRYGTVDIALDSFPYSAGSTTGNALWQGVPVIAISGASWRERNSASILAGAGLVELIASDVDDYIEKAVSLANDRARMQRYRQTISRTMCASPQWQTDVFARNFERTLRGMWHDWLAQPSGCTLKS